MKFYYFVDKEGVRQGPLPLDDLSTYDISPTTLVWTKGMEKWLKAKDVDDFRDILQSSQVTNDILPATENPEETPKNIPNTSPVSSENEYVDEVSTEETEEKSSNLKYWIIGAVLVVIVSIVFFGYNKTESVTDTVDTLAIDSVSESDYVDEENIVKEFIVNMYNNHLYDEYRFLENHCTRHLLDVLRADYEYDGTGYAVWNLEHVHKMGNPIPNMKIKLSL